jgi:hypothetical protein
MMMIRSLRAVCLLVIVLAVGLAGCGTEAPRQAAGTTQAGAAPRGECQPVGQMDDESLTLCFAAAGRDQGRFFLETGATQRELGVLPPRPTPSASDAGRVGHWAWAALSPDGQTILGQWSGECEVPIAFLTEVGGGRPEPVTGEDDWAHSPESVALGWTTDGRAIVFLPKGPACGSGVDRPGIYLYSTSGRGKLIVGTKRTPLEPSIEPRSVAAIRRAGS